jgi:hypothetical protein
MQVNSGTASERSSIARQLPLSPMCFLAVRIEHALDVEVQRPQGDLFLAGRLSHIAIQAQHGNTAFANAAREGLLASALRCEG